MLLKLGLALGRRDFVPEDLPDGGARLLFDWWERSRGERLMPSREDFSPSEMRAILPDLAMFDVERDPHRYRVRLYGTGLAAKTGTDLSGRYIDEIPGAEQVAARCDQLVAQRVPYFRERLQARWADNSWREYDVLSLPLSQTGERVDIILFHLSFH